MKRYEEHPDGGMREDELGAYVRFDDYWASRIDVKHASASIAQMALAWVAGPGAPDPDTASVDRLAALVERRLRRFVDKEKSVSAQKPMTANEIFDHVIRMGK